MQMANSIANGISSLLDQIDSEKEKQKKLVELNVLEQCKNIQNSSIIQQATNKNEINIYGWVFDISTGKLIDLKFNSE